MASTGRTGPDELQIAIEYALAQVAAQEYVYGDGTVQQLLAAIGYEGVDEALADAFVADKRAMALLDDIVAIFVKPDATFEEGVDLGYMKVALALRLADLRAAEG